MDERCSAFDLRPSPRWIFQPGTHFCLEGKTSRLTVVDRQTHVNAMHILRTADNKYFNGFIVHVWFRVPNNITRFCDFVWDFVIFFIV